MYTRGCDDKSSIIRGEWGPPLEKSNAMHENQRASEVTGDGLARMNGPRAGRVGESPEEALRIVLDAGSGQRLESLLSERDERAERARKLDKERRRLQQEERNRAQREAEWEQFMQRETRELGLRKDGQLARLLGEPHSGEPAVALQRLADEDRRQAEEGLVALMSGGEIRYKPLDELSPEDMPARIAAERLRTAWLKKRQDGWLPQGKGSL